MGNRARPFAVKVKVGSKPTVWEKTGVTRRNGVTYNWYRGVDGRGQMILPADVVVPNVLETTSINVTYSEDGIIEMGEVSPIAPPSLTTPPPPGEPSK